jgi:hypothetical protein
MVLEEQKSRLEEAVEAGKRAARRRPAGEEGTEA